jgi:hypothetical protein
MNPEQIHPDEQVIVRYTDQPPRLPAVLRRRIESGWGAFGLVSLIALGMLFALIGSYGVMQERPPDDERAHAHQGNDRAAWRATIAPDGGAGDADLFWLTDRWENLQPVQSQSRGGGLLGGALAMLANGSAAGTRSGADRLIVGCLWVIACRSSGVHHDRADGGAADHRCSRAAINLPQIARGRRTTDGVERWVVCRRRA